MMGYLVDGLRFSPEGNAVGSSLGGALGNVVGQQDAGQIVGGVAGELSDKMDIICFTIWTIFVFPHHIFEVLPLFFQLCYRLSF